MANAGIYYGRPSTVHKIDFTASSVPQSTAFSADTSYVMLCAKTAGSYLPKDEVILIKVSGGDKIGAIREASTSGSLYATEMV